MKEIIEQLEDFISRYEYNTAWDKEVEFAKMFLSILTHKPR